MKHRGLISVICVLAMVATLLGVVPAAAESTANVLITEDFEGESPAFIGNQGTLLPVDETTDSGTDTGSGCDGTAATAEEADTEAVNHYMDLYLATVSDYSGYNYGSSAQEYVDSMPESFMLTADIYQEADNTNDFFFEYFSDENVILWNLYKKLLF